MGRIEFFPFNSKEEADAFQDEQVRVLQRHKLAKRYRLGQDTRWDAVERRTVYRVILIEVDR